MRFSRPRSAPHNLTGCSQTHSPVEGAAWPGEVASQGSNAGTAPGHRSHTPTPAALDSDCAEDLGPHATRLVLSTADAAQHSQLDVSVHPDRSNEGQLDMRRAGPRDGEAASQVQLGVTDSSAGSAEPVSRQQSDLQEQQGRRRVVEAHGQQGRAGGRRQCWPAEGARWRAAAALKLQNGPLHIPTAKVSKSLLISD